MVDEERGCDEFRTGKFVFVSGELDNENWIVIRTKDYQIEKDTVNGQMSKSEIIWVNNCDYKLVYTELVGYETELVEKVLYDTLEAKFIGQEGDVVEYEVKGVFKDFKLRLKKVSSVSDN